MSKIKIHELPEIRFGDIKNTDICIIENENDTYKTPVSDLKIIFSNDSKIQSIYEELLLKIAQIIENGDISNTEITDILNDHTNKINSMYDSMTKITSRVVIIENNIQSITTALGALTDRVTSTESRLDSIDDLLDVLVARITALEKDNTNNKDRLTTIEAKNNTQDSSIVDIYKLLDELKELIEGYNGVSSDSLSKVEKELNDKITEKYNELIQLIDECHHHTPLIE